MRLRLRAGAGPGGLQTGWSPGQGVPRQGGLKTGGVPTLGVPRQGVNQIRDPQTMRYTGAKKDWHCWVFSFGTFNLNHSWILSQLSYERVLYVKSFV